MRSRETSLLSLSRRELISRVVATGIGGAVCSTFGSRPLLGQPNTQALVNSVVAMGDNIAAQPPLVRQWLQNSETARGGRVLQQARNVGFDNDFHESYANQWEFIDPMQPAYTRFIVQDAGTRTCLMGVYYHPWMHILGYAPNRTLNYVESESLRPTTVFLERRFRLARNGVMAIAPFPDTLRMRPAQEHVDGFARIVLDANMNPNDFVLRYVRFYLMAVVSSYGTQEPQPILAHAYSYPRYSRDLQLNYSLVRL